MSNRPYVKNQDGTFSDMALDAETLAGASKETSLTNSDTKIPTSKAVKNFVEGKGYTTNTGTVTSVSAGTGLSISGTSTVNPKVNIDSNYKLPTLVEWGSKQTLIEKSLYNIGAYDSWVVNSDGTVTITRQTGYVYSGDISSAGYEGTTGGNKRFKILTKFTLPGDHNNANIICNKYTYSPDPVSHWDTASDKTICIYGNAIYVIDNDYSNGAEFKASLKDFQFEYKLSSSYTEKAIRNIPYYDSHNKEPVLLWENGSPSTTFTGGTINLSQAKSNFKFIVVAYISQKGGNYYKYGKVPSGSQIMLDYVIAEWTNGAPRRKVLSRPLYYNSDTSFNVDHCYGDGDFFDDYVIPVAIYGTNL